MKGASGQTYAVNAQLGTCTCPSYKFAKGGKECKHLRQVRDGVQDGAVGRAGAAGGAVGGAVAASSSAAASPSSFFSRSAQPSPASSGVGDGVGNGADDGADDAAMAAKLQAQFDEEDRQQGAKNSTGDEAEAGDAALAAALQAQEARDAQGAGGGAGGGGGGGSGGQRRTGIPNCAPDTFGGNYDERGGGHGGGGHGGGGWDSGGGGGGGSTSGLEGGAEGETSPWYPWRLLSVRARARDGGNRGAASLQEMVGVGVLQPSFVFIANYMLDFPWYLNREWPALATEGGPPVMVVHGHDIPEKRMLREQLPQFTFVRREPGAEPRSESNPFNFKTPYVLYLTRVTYLCNVSNVPNVLP